jgi:hypothetical protein
MPHQRLKIIDHTTRFPKQNRRAGELFSNLAENREKTDIDSSRFLWQLPGIMNGNRSKKQGGKPAFCSKFNDFSARLGMVVAWLRVVLQVVTTISIA